MQYLEFKEDIEWNKNVNDEINENKNQKTENVKDLLMIESNSFYERKMRKKVFC